MSRIAEKLAQIKAQRALSREEAQLQRIESNVDYVDYLLAKDDSAQLDEILSNISKAYNAPVYTGYMFDDNVEKIVAICSKLQYAKGTVREAIPADYYEVFDRTLRDKVLEAYGALPYHREPTVIEVAEGEFETLDEDLVARAKTGIKPDVAKLQTAIDIISDELQLQVRYTVPQHRADIAWNSAVARVANLDKLEQVKGELKASI